MSVTSTTGFEQSIGHEAAVIARAGKPHMAAEGKEAEPLGQGVPRQEPGNENNTGAAAGFPSSAETRAPKSTAGQASSGTQRLKQARSVLNESADEEAFRLRSSGMTYRQIGEKMGVDQSMAHRRVKRQMMRQKMYLNEKLEEARDFELEKLRQMEQALMPEAFGGDHKAIKLVLRIMEMRRRYLKDIPLEHSELFPSIEDRAEMLAEVVDAEWERKGRPGEEPTDDGLYPADREWTPEEASEPAERAREEGEGGSCGEQKERRTSNKEQSNVEVKEGKRSDESNVDRETVDAPFAKMWKDAAEAVRQKLATEGVTANEAASTEPSMKRSAAEPRHDALPPSASSLARSAACGCSSNGRSTKARPKAMGRKTQRKKARRHKAKK